MIFWYEHLVEHVLGHFRRLPYKPFSFAGAWKAFMWTMRDIGIELAQSFALLLTGLIPLVGAPLVFLGGSYLMGKSVKDPYDAVLRSQGETNEVDLHPWTLPALGWGQMLIAIIPFGWFSCAFRDLPGHWLCL